MAKRSIHLCKCDVKIGDLFDKELGFMEVYQNKKKKYFFHRSN